MKQLIEHLLGTNYDRIFKEMVDSLLGPTGAEVAGWFCLALATFLILRRRVTSIGLILFLYMLAWVFAYIPGIIRILKGG